MKTANTSQQTIQHLSQSPYPILSVQGESTQNPPKSKTSHYPILSVKGRKGQSGSPFKGAFGFTLVELIIVITILAILATIAFMSFQGYAKQSRDSNRLTTIKTIEKGIDLFMTKSGKIPVPDEAASFTGGSATNPVTIKQGYVGAQMIQAINMNQIPLDPKTQSKYHYSVFGEKIYYQIGIEQEQDSVSYISPTFAESEEVMISGNYRLDPSLPSLFVVEDSVGAGGIFDPSVCFVVEGSENTFSSASGSCISKSQMPLSSFDESLVGYWDMETYFQENYDGKNNVVFLKDLSGNNHNLYGFQSGGYLISTVTLSGSIFTGGILGKGVNFDNNKFKYIFNTLKIPIDTGSTKYVRPDFGNTIYTNTGGGLITGISLTSIIDFDYNLGLNWNIKRITSFGKYNNGYIDSGDVSKLIDSAPYRFTSLDNKLHSYILPYNYGTNNVGYGTQGYFGCGGRCGSALSTYTATSIIKGKNILTSNLNFESKEACVYVNGVKNFCYPLLDSTLNRLKEGGYKYTVFKLSGLDEPFAGIIDEVKIYNRALSDQEIAQQARIAGF